MTKPQIILKLEEKYKQPFIEVDVSNVADVNVKKRGWGYDFETTKYSINNQNEIVGLTIPGFYHHNTSDFLSSHESELLKLTHLNLIANSIKDLSFLRAFNNLEVLHIGNNDIKDISPLSYLTKIRELDLETNKITDLNPLRSNIHLEKLWIAANRIEDLSQLMYYKNLKVLDLSNIWYPNIDFLIYCNSLEILKLNSCFLDDLTPLLNLKKLRHLMLADNKLSDISYLSGLKNLKAINLEYNKISDISPLSNLINLTHIYIGYNKIENINPLKDLKRIEVLRFTKNEVKDVTPILRLFEDEKSNITFYDNPIITPPIEILNHSRALADWLKNPKIDSNEIKVILVGNSTVGKTSLIDFFQNKFAPSNNCSTHGINIKTVKYNDFTVNFWDFGGQDYYHATHRLFLTSNTVYILMWEKKHNKTYQSSTEIQIDDNSTRKNLVIQHYDYYHWLKLIRRYDNLENVSIKTLSPIIMLQNKVDLPKNEYERLKDDIKKYGVEDKNSFAISILKTNEYKNLDKKNNEVYNLSFRQFENAFQNILKSKIENFKIVKYYKEIREMVRYNADKHPIISYNDYKKFCRNYVSEKITDDQIGYATEYLHNTGVLIYYGYQSVLQNSILAEYVFINPQYVTDTVYKILNDNVFQNEGKFNKNHVTQIIGSENSELFINLLQSPNFELIFEFQHEKDTYYATQFLPDFDKLNTNLRSEILEKKEVFQIAFIIRFEEFFTNSFISRLIARYGFYSESDENKFRKFWKYGISFRRRGCSFLVHCEFEEQKIYVRTENGKLKNEIVSEIYDTIREVTEFENNISMSFDDNEYEPLVNIEKYDQEKFWFCFSNRQESIAIKENNIKIEGNGNITLQDINGSQITINYNETEKLDVIIEEFKQNQNSHYNSIIQSLEFIRQTIIWIKNAIQPIDQIKELVYKIAKNQEKGFESLHQRHDKHDFDI